MTSGVSSLSIDPEEVKALGRLAYDLAGECRSGYASLVTDVRATIDGWSGNNASTFAAGWDEFHEGADQIWDALFDLAAKLGVTAQSLGTVDESFSAEISSLDLP
ncbi:WXG100 family type VII secretion target [Nocardia sp. NPDC127579]|uniref:WXG100 family type VII secretion target n=1 Tax=Nocardia sp. NPDC127579 TaxID=3345402 RepID=UPI0036442BCC